MIEKNTAKTVLQKPKEVKVGGRTYLVKPPTIATIIEVSHLVAELPVVDMEGMTDHDVFPQTLKIAKDVGVVGEIGAILILGAKRKYNIYHKIKAHFLAEKINHDLTIKESRNLIMELLNEMEVFDFFGLITSLSAVNLLKQTREVTETIQSGQSSQESQKVTT